MGSLDNNIRLIRNETVEGGNTKERIAGTFELLVTELDRKVNKVPGKKLTTEDFTTELRQKLEGLQQVDISLLLPRGNFTGTAQDLKDLIDNLTRILQSPDTELDELREIVAYIKQNKHILSTLGINNIAGLEEALANKADKDHNHDKQYAPITHHHNEYAYRTHRHNKDDIDGLPNNLATTENVKTAIDGIQIGGRNLLLNSGQKITNNNYNVATYLLTEELKVGDLLTITIKGQLGNGKTAFALYDQLGNIEQCALFDKGAGIYQNTFNYRGYRNGDKMILTTWTYPSSVDVNSTIEWIKLEKGNKPTDWSPAPEDIENKVADIQTDLQNAINNAKALIAIETQNRQQTDTNVSKLVNKTNFLSDTYIEGNTVATGTMILGNSLGVQAGITGVGAANNDVRLWAGSNYTNRANAPFHVLQDGTLHATNAHISGQIEAQSGKISGNLELLGVLYSGNWEREIVNGKETIKGENVNGGTYYGGRGIIYRQDDRGIYTAIGGVAGSVTGVTESMNVISRKPLYPKSKYNLSSFTGQILSVPPHPNDEIDVSLSYKNNRAQTIYGDTVSFGANSLFEYVYTGVADSGTIHEWLGVTNIFVFSDVASNFREIYLPNASIVVSILSKFGFENISRKELSLSFEITIVLSYSVGGKRIRLSGIEGGHLLDNDGNRSGGGNGYIDLARGDSIKVRFYAGDYYIISLSR